MNSCKDISLLIIKGLHTCLVNGRRNTHDSFWFILDSHDGKLEDQCYEAILKLKGCQE